MTNASLSGGRMVRAPGRGTHAPVVRVRNPPGIMSLHARGYEKGNDARWRFIICIYCCKLASVPRVRIKMYYKRHTFCWQSILEGYVCLTYGQSYIIGNKRSCEIFKSLGHKPKVSWCVQALRTRKVLEHCHDKRFLDIYREVHSHISVTSHWNCPSTEAIRAPCCTFFLEKSQMKQNI